MIKDTNRTESGTKKFFYGWWVVVAAAVLQGIGSGSVYYGFNTFFNPMIEEFHWSRTVTSGAFSMARLEGGIEGIIIGPLIDRFGARIVAFGGVIAVGLGFITLLLVNGNVISLYVIFGLLLSMGYNAFASRATIAAAAQWFIRKRGLAISFIMAGGGIGGAVLVPLLAWLIMQFGWRSAAVIIGVIVLAVGLPGVYFMRSKPEDKGLLPDGDVMPKVTAGAHIAQVVYVTKEIDFTVREALKTSAFWTYTFGMSLRSCVLGALVVHEIPYLTDIGIDYTAAAGALGMMILISVPGRLFFGWLGDVYSKKVVMFVTCVLQAAGIWILIHVNGVGMLWAFVVVYGLGYGGIAPLQHAIRGDLFGRKAFATIAGVVNIFTAISTVASTVVAGYLYDISHSYVVAFYGLAIAVGVAGIAFLSIRQPKAPARVTP